MTITNDNIRVIARLKPLTSTNNNINVSDHLQYTENTIQLHHNNKPSTYTFDYILSPTSTQLQCYTVVANEIIHDILDGYNGCIFAYGQTGSGKTYSMTGMDASIELHGIIPRCCNELFIGLRSSNNIDEITIKVTFVEIYREKLHDLLGNGSNNDKLKLRQDALSGDVYVDNVTSVYVTCVSDILKLLVQGNNKRMISSTNMNEQSSRSHSIFTLDITQKLNNGQLKCSKLSLVDLAGSERISKTNATGQQLLEGCSINSSLSVLGKVISALSSTQRDHIPYRDSTLTYLLKNSLGGNCKTTILINCSCNSDDIHETLSTLQFGRRAKSIKTQAVINVKLSAEQLQKQIDSYKLQLHIAHKQIKSLTHTLSKTNQYTNNTDNKLLVEGLIDELSNEYSMADTTDDSLHFSDTGSIINSPHSAQCTPPAKLGRNVSDLSLLRSSSEISEYDWEQRCLAAEQSRDSLQNKLNQLLIQQRNSVHENYNTDETDRLIDKLTTSLQQEQISITSTDVEHIIKLLGVNKQLEVQHETMQYKWAQYIQLVQDESKLQQLKIQQQIQDAVHTYTSTYQNKFVQSIKYMDSTTRSINKQWLVRENVYSWIGSKWQRRSLELSNNAIFLYSVNKDYVKHDHISHNNRLLTSIALCESVTVKRVTYADQSNGVVLQWNDQMIQLKAIDAEQQIDIVFSLRQALQSFQHNITQNNTISSTDSSRSINNLITV